MVIFADKTALQYYSVAVVFIQQQQGRWTSPSQKTSIDLTMSVCWAECGLPGVWRRASTHVPEHHMASDSRERCSVQPRVDQSKHTNETLIGLYFRPWLSAPSFPSLAHWHAPCPILSASFKTAQCSFLNVCTNNVTVATTHSSALYSCSELVFICGSAF